MLTQQGGPGGGLARAQRCHHGRRGIRAFRAVDDLARRWLLPKQHGPLAHPLAFREQGPRRKAKSCKKGLPARSQPKLGKQSRVHCITQIPPFLCRNNTHPKPPFITYHLGVRMGGQKVIEGSSRPPLSFLIGRNFYPVFRFKRRPLGGVILEGYVGHVLPNPNLETHV